MMRSCLFLLLLPAVSLADVEMRFDDGSVGLVHAGQVLFGDDHNAALWQGVEEGVIVISFDEQSWMRITPGFANDVAARMQERMDQILSELPPEQRAVAEEQMKEVMPSLQQDPARISVRRTGGQETIAGFTCALAEISYDGGEPEEAVCVATAAELGITDADFRALNAAMRGMADIAALDPHSDPGADFAQMGGVPIRSRDLISGDGSELVSIDTAAVDPARLRVPANFREVSIEELMRQ
jgi:hypothetical protein